MQTTYKVFNPKTGVHENAESIDQALKMRQDLIDAWINEQLQEAKAIHSIAAINKNENGDELWVALNLN
jgi:predicted RNase H-like HicB family nuclease